MIISLFSGNGLEVSDEIAAKVDVAMTRKDPDNPPPKAIKVPLLNGETPVIVVSSINGIWSNDQWETMQHEKAGDFKCLAGHWHPKGQQCAHQSTPLGIRPEQLKSAAGTEHKNSYVSPEITEAARRNLANLQKTGQIGTEGLTAAAIARIEEMRKRKEANRVKYGRQAGRLTPAQQERVENNPYKENIDKLTSV